jgi:hypothetical protein
MEVTDMRKPYGDPVVTMRLPREMIAGAKMAAARHDTTLSGLVRELIADRLDQDGIPWQMPPEPTTGQITLDECVNA